MAAFVTLVGLTISAFLICFGVVCAVNWNEVFTIIFLIVILFSGFLLSLTVCFHRK